SRLKPLENRTGLADGTNDSGRWVEADFQAPDGSTVSVASVYVHSGEVDTPRQDDKYAFLDAMVEYLPVMKARQDHSIITGDLNVVEVGRRVAGEVAGPYTWWSYRGKAFDNDAGWRIDYQMATPQLAENVTKAVVDRAASYDLRFSDHSPLVVDYQF